MPATAIFGPFLAMLLLTFAVWLLMYIRRLGFIRANKIEAQELTTPQRAAALIPEPVSYPAYNLQNLFELPVVFYAVCIYLYVVEQVDAVHVYAAWLFFGGRVVHSVIHCTRNVVMLRFLAYLVSAVALWFIVVRASLAYF
jgi:hypothetical protein